MKKIFKNSIFTFILGIILTCSLGYVYAVEKIGANQVGYMKDNGTWMSASEVIDELYSQSVGFHYLGRVSGSGSLNVRDILLSKNISNVDFSLLNNNNFVYKIVSVSAPNATRTSGWSSEQYSLSIAFNTSLSYNASTYALSYNFTSSSSVTSKDGRFLSGSGSSTVDIYLYV